MRFTAVIALFLLTFMGLSAQPPNIHWEGQDFVKGRSYKLYGDNVSLRKLPHAEAEKISSLDTNENIEILEITDKNYSIYGNSSPWVKVKTEDGSEGYIVSGLISLESFTLSDGSTILTARAKSDEGLYDLLKMRRVKDQAIMELGSHILNNASLSFHLHDSRGLKNVDHVFEISYLAEGCGDQGGCALFVIDSSKNDLIYLGTFSNVGDGGIYHEYERLIFPDDKDGQQGALIYEGEEGEENPDTGEYRTVSKRKIYDWTEVQSGKKITPFTYD